jgi:MFS family permease
MIIPNISKQWKVIIVLALFKLFIHLITNTNYELHRDAFLYYSLGENLDFGFMSVPPLIGLISKISIFLFGNTVFALRFFPAVIGFLSVIIISKIVKELGGNTFAIVIAVCAFIFSPAFLRSNSLFQPVSFNQFFWLLSGYLILKLIKSQNPFYWIYIFITFGFAFLNKYSIAFFIVSALLSILFSAYRKLFISKYFLWGGLIGVIIILPNILWQYAHNWPLILHFSELQKHQFVNVSIMGFVIDQFVMNLPGTIVWLSALLVLLFYKPEKEYRIFGFLYLICVLILVLFRGKSYYSLGLYPILFAFGGYVVDKYFRIYSKYIVLVFIFLVSTPMLPLSLPIYSHEKIEEYSQPMGQFVNRWEDGEIHNIPQDYADMIGWKELSDIVINHYNSLDKNVRDSCLIFAENYGQAGSIYGKCHNLPRPLSFSDNFLFWSPDSVINGPMIYVNYELGDIELLYDSIQQIAKIENIYFRENGLKVFFCTKPLDTFSDFYSKKITEMKSGFY